MAARIEIDGKFFRMRRGKLVEIPMKWLNKITTQGTIRNRNSKGPKKLRAYRPLHTDIRNKRIDCELQLAEVV